MMPIIHHEPEQVYHARQQVSNSMLKVLEKSTPWDFWAQYIAEPPLIVRETSKAMAIGSLVHCLTLEPEAVDQRYFIDPENTRQDARQKAFQKVIEKADGREIVKQQDFDAAREMRDALRANPTIDAILSRKGFVECTVLWTDPETGIECRGRVDYLCIEPGYECALDIKKTTDVAPREFARAVGNYAYHTQGPFYLDGVASAEAGLEHFASVPFIWGVVQPGRPRAEAYAMADDDIDKGRARYRSNLDKLKWCQENDTWPSFTDEVGLLTLPDWVFYERNTNVSEVSI